MATMQSINAVIQNPLFLITFFSPVLVLPWLAWIYRDGNSVRFSLLICACILYVIGTFGVTILGNVPLNRKLEQFKVIGASEENIAFARGGFERAWNRLHTIRTIASILAMVLIFAACLER